MSEEEAQKLSDYKPGIANARVSIIALWEHMKSLEAIANDPAAVKAWTEKVFNEIGEPLAKVSLGSVLSG